ncbi:MAG: uroporphyrinogen-III synthase [Pseudomonadota bacterium]
MARTPARVLVTRPVRDAERTAEALRRRGHDPVIAPVLQFEPLQPKLPERPWKAILLTSRNAANVAPAAVDRTRPCFVVGSTTGRAAAASGFTDIRTAGGDAAALADLVIENLEPSSGSLLYLCGRHRTGNLAEQLETAGFEVELAECYDMLPLSFAPDVIRELEAGAIDAVLLYSPRSAHAFASAIVARDLPRTPRILALSRAVLAALPSHLAERAIASAEPREAALLDMLDRMRTAG